MKKDMLVVTLLCSTLLLGACSKKEQASKEEVAQKIEQFQKENKDILEKAKENEVFAKTFVFEKDENGVSQKQTVTYKNSTFLSLVVKNTIPTSEGLKSAIEEVGLEESQKLLKESFFESADVKEVVGLSGFTIDIELTSPNEYVITSDYDFSTLDVQKVVNLEYFKTNKLAELIQNTPEEYIQNLLRSGAKEEAGQGV
jgi:conserved uncharacterized protein